ncbi:MAG: anthranilate synthase family protein [Nocardioidaceae bacterium]
MTHLIHTEYVLEGHTTKDVREVLRDSMFAATVTGSPVENACRLISRYESEGRGYYGAVLALLGRDAAGEPTLDAPILLRTADVSPDGELRVTAGATLVRDSDAAAEVAETHAKAGGILRAFGLVAASPTPAAEVAALAVDPDAIATLDVRNRRLSRFWLNDQSDAVRSSALGGKHVVILDGEDDFVTMLRHLLTVLGMTSETVRHHDYQAGDFDRADFAIVGPGPGDPRALDDPKIKAVRGAVEDLLCDEVPFLAVCLGHQVLCGILGLELGYKDIVFQGTQTEVEILGRAERVGFYNTFVARLGPAVLPLAARVDCDAASGDVHLIQGAHYCGVQFHAESILTEHGFDLIRDLMFSLLDE